MIPASKIYFTEDDIKSITNAFSEILRGNGFLSTGKYTRIFEERYAEKLNVAGAVACNSGTSALEIIFRAIGIFGRDVLVPSNTFVATINAILNAGGTPVFIDCNSDMCASYKSIVEKFTPRVAAVCIVNIAGHITSDLLEIQNFCKKNDVKLIEDAAQSHGSIFAGQHSGTLGHASGFSFFSTKVLTTGEGGLVATNDLNIVEVGRKLREFGKVPDGYITNQYEFIGYNWRMPEISSLMGLAQLDRFDEILLGRSRAASRYDQNFSGSKVVSRIKPAAECIPNNYKYVIDVSKVDRRKLHEHFIANGIQPSGYVYELPLHDMKLFEKFNGGDLPMTDYICRNHFCLPIYPSISDEHIDQISAVLIDYMEANSGY